MPPRGKLIQLQSQYRVPLKATSQTFWNLVHRTYVTSAVKLSCMQQGFLCQELGRDSFPASAMILDPERDWAGQHILHAWWFKSNDGLVWASGLLR